MKNPHGCLKCNEYAAENAALRKDAERLRGELALIAALQAGDGSTINGPTRDDFGRAFRMAQDIARTAMEASHRCDAPGCDHWERHGRACETCAARREP